MSWLANNLSRASIGLLCALSACGCHARWSTGGDVARVEAPRQEVSPRTPAVAGRPLGEASRAAQQQDLADVLHEVELLGSTDPAAQQQLLRSLQQSKPELWPLVVQQFRASLAYHQQLVGEQQAGAPSVASVEPPPELSRALMWPSEPAPVMQTNYETPPEEVSAPPEVPFASLSTNEEPATGSQAVPLDEPQVPAALVLPTAASTDEVIDDPQESNLLELRHLAFCQKVYGYGAYDSYDEARFSPAEQVSLYVEVGNYCSEPSEEGFATKLAAGYQILDERGERVDGGQFPEVIDLCRSRRRDFHIQYGLVLPDTIAPGKYQLRLAMRDLQSGKVGQETIKFEVGGEP